jgi:hypothetical protein
MTDLELRKLADDLGKDLAIAQGVIDHLRNWIADLQSGMYVNCVYCGHRYGPNETTPVSMADALKAHIAQCPEHPMAGLLKVCGGILGILDGFTGHDFERAMRAVKPRIEMAVAKAEGK